MSSLINRTYNPIAHRYISLSVSVVSTTRRFASNAGGGKNARLASLQASIYFLVGVCLGRLVSRMFLRPGLPALKGRRQVAGERLHYAFIYKLNVIRNTMQFFLSSSACQNHIFSPPRVCMGCHRSNTRLAEMPKGATQGMHGVPQCHSRAKLVYSPAKTSKERPATCATRRFI